MLTFKSGATMPLCLLHLPVNGRSLKGLGQLQLQQLRGRGRRWIVATSGIAPLSPKPRGHCMSPGALIRSAGYRGLRRSPKRTRAATPRQIGSTVRKA